MKQTKGFLDFILRIRFRAQNYFIVLHETSNIKIVKHEKIENKDFYYYNGKTTLF